MSELKSEELKNAVVLRLMDVAPECAVYKEAVTEPVYPHIYVHQITVGREETRKGHFTLTYSFDLRYRVASDPSTRLKLEQELESMGLKLLGAFYIIDCGESKVRCLNPTYEKVDGVLHFTFTIKVHTAFKDEDYIKQNKINVSMEVKQ